jgi:hypothetical protein
MFIKYKALPTDLFINSDVVMVTVTHLCWNVPCYSKVDFPTPEVGTVPHYRSSSSSHL